LIQDLLGGQCGTVRTILYRLGDEPDGKLAALELGWTNGQITTLDANADWTLGVAFRGWEDPLAGASAEERFELAREVGLWESVPTPDDLKSLIGLTVTVIDPILNEVGELVGLEFVFGGVVLIVTLWAGELSVRVCPR